MFRSFSDKKSPRKSFRLKPPFTRHAISILICAACMLCATLASFLYQHIVPDNHANVALFYILALVIIARWTVGYGYGIACTLFSVIAINYLFTYPYYTLNFTLTGYPITFLLMSGITLILCTMTSHMTIQSEMIAEREKRLAEAEMEKMRANLLRAQLHSLHPQDCGKGALCRCEERDGDGWRTHCRKSREEDAGIHGMQDYREG